MLPLPLLTYDKGERYQEASGDIQFTQSIYKERERGREKVGESNSWLFRKRTKEGHISPRIPTGKEFAIQFLSFPFSGTGKFRHKSTQAEYKFNFILFGKQRN